MKKDNSIVFWRIIFSYVIVVFHLLNVYGIGSSLYIATDFFFIVSGFLIARDADVRKFDSAFVMLKHKIRALYPHYILSLVVGYIVFFLVQKGPRVSAIELLCEIGMFQMVGLNILHMINVPTWYLSVLLIGGYVIYFMLLNYKKIFVEILCPSFIIVVYSWFYRTYGFLSHSSLGSEITTGIYWNRPLLIGISTMCLGVIGYELLKISQCRHIFSEGGQRIFEFILLLSIPLLALVLRRTVYDFVFVGVLFCGVLFAFSNGSFKLSQNKVIIYFSKLSYPLYLNHNMFRELLPIYVKQFSILVLLGYVVMVTLYSMVTMLIIDTTIKNRKETKNG